MAANQSASLPNEERLQLAIKAWKEGTVKSIRKAAALSSVPSTPIKASLATLAKLDQSVS